MPELDVTLTPALAGDGPPPISAGLRIGPWQVQIGAPGDAHSSHGPSGVQVWLVGQLYGTALSEVPELYLQAGLEFPERLEGSFALLLLDPRAGRVLVVTDRMNTRKVHVGADGARHLISTRPDWGPFRDQPLSAAGLASFLVSGSPFNGLTLYSGVRALERAGVTEWGRAGAITRRYWQAPAPGTPARADSLETELQALLGAAVQRRLDAAGDHLWLSLSGGYDSRGLLALLARSGRPLHTFSYALNPGRVVGDAHAAAALARQYGARHSVLPAYRGDLVATVRRGARWGRGAAPFCEETDAWAELEAHAPSDVFVGEQPFEVGALPLHSVPEQLAQQRLKPLSALGWLEPRLDPAVWQRLRQEWQAELDAIVAGAAGWREPERQEQWLLTEQLLPAAMLPWRLAFAGHAARVHTPYLDGTLLDLAARLSPGQLAGKALFRAALRRLDPELFRVPLATAQGYEADWAAELWRHRARIEAELLAGPSRLDDALPPEVLRAVLADIAPASGLTRARGDARRRLGTLRRTPLGLRVLGLPPFRPPTVDPATFLLRALTLREVLRP